MALGHRKRYIPKSIYPLRASNPWWGPAPQRGEVATAVMMLNIESSYLTLIKEPESYQLLFSSVPYIQDFDRSPSGYTPYATSSILYQQNILAQLHDLQEGIKVELMGKDLWPHQYSASYQTLLVPSPYLPTGIWEYVPPEGPFDLRRRAKTTVPRTTEPAGSLEKVVMRIVGYTDPKNKEFTTARITRIPRYLARPKP